MMIVATKTDNAAPEDRGRILGLVEYEHHPAFVGDLFDADADDPRWFKNGQFRWPHAVPALRAWLFPEKPELVPTIGRQFSMAATTSFVDLYEAEERIVHSLTVEEVGLPENTAFRRATRKKIARSTRLERGKPGQPGPAPSEWSKIVSREDGPTAVYALRFGKEGSWTDCWKVGLSKNPNERCRSLNFSVPSEVLSGFAWHLRYLEVWPSGPEAYEMEQSVLAALSESAQGSERVVCGESEFLEAWTLHLRGQKR